MFRTDPDQRLETAVLGALDQDDLASKAERALTKGEASEHSTSDAPEIGKAGFSDFTFALNGFSQGIYRYRVRSVSCTGTDGAMSMAR